MGDAYTIYIVGISIRVIAIEMSSDLQKTCERIYMYVDIIINDKAVFLRKRIRMSSVYHLYR